MKANLNHRPSAPRWASHLRGLTREVTIGVVIGVIVLALTPLVNHLTTAANAKKQLRANLSSVRLGMAQGYLDDLFGFPIIQTKPFWYEDYPEPELTSAGYKLRDAVLLCMFQDDALAAFVVVVNDKALYQLPTMTFMKRRQLLNFTYADVMDGPLLRESTQGLAAGLPSFTLLMGNVPGNNSDYAYYYELYYGGGPADYNYFLYGSYQDGNINLESGNLMAMGQNYYLNPEKFSEQEWARFSRLREWVRPNVFGIISGQYAEEFDFVFDIVQSRENGALLFDDWFAG